MATDCSDRHLVFFDTSGSLALSHEAHPQRTESHRNNIEVPEISSSPRPYVNPFYSLPNMQHAVTTEGLNEKTLPVPFAREAVTRNASE
jgi:hypothetical protein